MSRLLFAMFDRGGRVKIGSWKKKKASGAVVGLGSPDPFGIKEPSVNVNTAAVGTGGFHSARPTSVCVCVCMSDLLAAKLQGVTCTVPPDSNGCNGPCGRCGITSRGGFIIPPVCAPARGAPPTPEPSDQWRRPASTATAPPYITFVPS